MKTIVFAIALAVTNFIFAQNGPQQSEETTQGTTITVTVPVKSNKGSVFVSLHNEQTFMRKGLVDLNTKIEDGKATVTFTDVAPGEYAVLLFHDTNDNKQMDFEANGMPKENYGVSNNVMNFGPPTWSDAKFEVGNEPVSLDIVM